MVKKGGSSSEAVGASQIITPHCGSSSVSSNDAGGSKASEEVTANCDEELKADTGAGGELTPPSREKEATSSSCPPGFGEEGVKGSVPPSGKPVEPATKSKKQKKKKKKNKASFTGEDGPPARVSQKSEEQPSSQSPEKPLEVTVDASIVHPEFPLSTSRVQGSSFVEIVDKKGRSGEPGSSSPRGRMKGDNAAAWAPKHSGWGSEPLPGSSWLPVEAEDLSVGAKDPSVLTDGGDLEWESHVVQPTGWGSPTASVVEDSGWQPAVSVAEDSGWQPAVSVVEDLGWQPAVSGVEDSGWQISDGEPLPVAGASTPHFSNRSWDEAEPKITTPDWDAGWEVAGPRRGKKGDSTFPAVNASQKAKGGRGSLPKSAEIVQRGPKQHSSEWETVNKSVRSPGYYGQETGGRGVPRNQPGPSKFGAPPRLATPQSSWGKPFNKANWETNSLSGASESSASILGTPLRQNRPAPGSNPGFHSRNDSSVSLDTWGGLPASSGNGSSVLEDYPVSVYSDSQCSDDDLDSDTISLASFESDDSDKSHATQRKSKWFRKFFDVFDLLSKEQLHEHSRQWHCPACQGGVGAIDWYRGLQPLLAHAKTVRSKRVKLHKLFAEVLEEEIRIRGATSGTHGSGKYGKWRGLSAENERKNIVWPPMVVVYNTQLEQDQDDKWIGMGNEELLDLFKTHNPVKARHSYGPQGHRGMSILMFGETPIGFYNAQRLEAQFIEARRGKGNWESAGKLLFAPGGDRILYGYMATTEDLETFNKHSEGKQNLKFEVKSLKGMVLAPMRKLEEESSKIADLEGKLQREQEATRALKNTMSQMSKKLEMREDEAEKIRARAKQQREQQEIQMEDLENLYKEKIEQLEKEIDRQKKTASESAS